MVTDEKVEQQAAFYALPQNAAQQTRLRRIRRRGFPADRVLAWFAQMHDLGRQGRYFGEFSTDIECFCESYGERIPDGGKAYDDWKGAAVDLWHAFQAAELVNLEGDPGNVEEGFRVKVLVMGEVNRPKLAPMSSAEKQRAYRERKKRYQDGNGVTRVTDGVTDGNGVTGVTSVTLRNPTYIQTDKHTDKQTQPSRTHADTPAHVGEPAHTDPPTHKAQAPSVDDRAKAEIKKCERQMGGNVAGYLEPLVSLYKDQNVAARPVEVLEDLYRPLSLLVSELGAPAVLAGVTASVKAGAPNMKYVEKAARSHVAKVGKGAGPVAAAVDLSEYESAFGEIV